MSDGKCHDGRDWAGPTGAAFECPRCGAEPCTPCRDRNGVLLAAPHWARRDIGGERA